MIVNNVDGNDALLTVPRCRRRWHLLHGHMPTVHREAGFEFRILTRDHPLPHIHVYDADGECVILLGSATEEPSIREREGMKLQRASRAVAIVRERQGQFLKRWNEIHGT